MYYIIDELGYYVSYKNFKFVYCDTVLVVL